MTQIEVAADDPAFSTPTKFIGQVYTQEQVEVLRSQHAWQFAKDGEFFRRIVPSPLSKNIVEIESVKTLLNEDTIIICVGGGGIPFVRDDTTKQYSGVEAVIDKDFATALLAEKLQANRLLLLTDVSNVMLDWGKPSTLPLHVTHTRDLEKIFFASGSMGPKVAAVCQFVNNTQNIAHIGALSEEEKIIQQLAGTTILP